MSRPRKTSDTLATRQVIFRITEAEYARLEAVSARAGLGVNELAKRLTRHRQHRIVIHVTQRYDPAYITQIRALGVNLNQLTMRSHLTGSISPNVEALCAEIRRVVFSAIENETAP